MLISPQLPPRKTSPSHVVSRREPKFGHDPIFGLPVEEAVQLLVMNGGITWANMSAFLSKCGHLLRIVRGQKNDHHTDQ